MKTLRTAFGLDNDIELSKLLPLGEGSNVKPNPHYVFPQNGILGKLVHAVKKQKNLWVSGPSGCGKTDLCVQFAERFDREAYVISFGEETSMRNLIGMQVLSNGETPWRDGALTKAIRRPNAIIVLDEINMAPPGVNAMLNHLLQNRELIIDETGEIVKMAEGTAIIATANTTGGMDEMALFAGSNVQNGATRNRFVGIKMDYLPPKQEESIIHLNFPRFKQVFKNLDENTTMTSLMVKTGNSIRAMIDAGQISMPFSVRQLMNWADASQDFIPVVNGEKDLVRGFCEGFKFAYADMLSPSEYDAVSSVFQLETSFALN